MFFFGVLREWLNLLVRSIESPDTRWNGIRITVEVVGPILLIHVLPGLLVRRAGPWALVLSYGTVPWYLFVRDYPVAAAQLYAKVPKAIKCCVAKIRTAAHRALVQAVRRGAQWYASESGQKIAQPARKAGDAVAQLFLPLVSIFVVPVLLLCLLMELTIYCSFLFLVASTWGVVYFELLKAICKRSAQSSTPPTLDQHLRDVAQQQYATCKPLPHLQKKFDTLAAKPHTAGLVPLLPAFRPSWSTLTEADAPYLVRYSKHCAFLSLPASTWKDIEQGWRVALHEQIRLLIREELARRPPSSDIEPLTVSHSVYELAGIAVRLLLPLPCLQPLSRPFRFGAFLPFLVTYPIAHVIRKRTTPSFPPNYSCPTSLHRTGAVPAFSHSLYAFTVTAQTSQVSPQDFSDLFAASLRLAAAETVACRAERLSHEAILNAVLVWKVRKTEEEERRLERE
ncbi:hypothetical protein JCM10213_005567 [Rhodosporidiobolus nylandii]